MTKGQARPRQRREEPKGVLKKPRPVWFVTLMAFVIPGSGQVFNGAPARGVIMQFGIVLGAFITYKLTTPEISPIGRMAGGLLVYVFSIVDANGIAKRRVNAWARIEAEQLRGLGAERGRRQGRERRCTERTAPTAAAEAAPAGPEEPAASRTEASEDFRVAASGRPAEPSARPHGRDPGRRTRRAGRGYTLRTRRSCACDRSSRREGHHDGDPLHKAGLPVL